VTLHLLLDLDHWQEVKAALVRNRARTLLAAFGVFWGIFLLMVMLGSGSGLQNGAMREFADSATNSFFLWTQRTQKPFAGFPAGRSPELTNADVDAIRERVPEVELVVGRNQLRGFGGGNNVTRGKRTGAFSVMGDRPEIRRVQSLRMERGRFLNAIDLEGLRKVAVIGTRVRELLFAPGEDPIGQSIVIQGVYFQVVGVFTSLQTGDGAERDAQTLYVPFTTFQRAFNYGDRVGWLAVVARPDQPARGVERSVLALLRERHHVAPDDLRAFGTFNLAEEYRKVQGLFTGIRIMVWLVGVGTLAAGVIGVSNIMLIVVKERTREIGVRRALGARPSAIVGQILSEALLLTSAAGYAGLVAGVGLVVGVARALPPGGAGMFLGPDVDVSEALAALGILVGAGLLAGWAPAQRALAVSPTVALRTE
jgi:putative ABC transport system permease protein